MQLFLTSSLPFLGHNHASAAAFLTSRRHNYHGSIIPEFLSNEERVRKFCEARQEKELEADKQKQNDKLYNLFVQTPLMQFSPSLVLHEKDCVETILKPLLETKYFCRTLQRCAVECPLSDDLLQSLSQVLSLTELKLAWYATKYEHLEIIVNSFPSLETLSIENAKDLDPTTTISISSPPPPATKTLESLTMRSVSGLFATQFVPHFTNLKKLVLSGDEDRLIHGELSEDKDNKLDLEKLSSALPLLTDLELKYFDLKNSKSLENLVDLSSLHFYVCKGLDLTFLANNRLPKLTTLRVSTFRGRSTSSFTFLAHAPNLRVLKLAVCHNFNNDCLQHLENMVQLRKLDLSMSNVVGDRRSLSTLMQNLFQLEELILTDCRVGNRGAIAGALYSTHSRLRVLNLEGCDLVDDDLDGIGALKNTLEVLYLTVNENLTNEALVHCRELVKLKKLTLQFCHSIDDLSPLKYCSNLEELNVSSCEELTDDSFSAFSEEPNSFPNLRVLDLSDCYSLSEEVFEHLANNNNLVYQLKELNVEGMSEVLESSKTARNNLCQLKELRQLRLDRFSFLFNKSESLERLKCELMGELKNLEGF